ncbi:hypothetical protein GJ496_008174 [Pomphorhynchus laevis]|nr:hypothetical protein GJ496_008174 [Pomphorhynchus laevis]
MHIRYEPNLDYFSLGPTLERRHCGSFLDVEIMYHVFRLMQSNPQPSLEQCSRELGISRRMLRRLLEDPIDRGDLQEVRSDVIGLTVPILEAMERELQYRFEKRSLGRRKRNFTGSKISCIKSQTMQIDFPIRRPLIHSVLYLISQSESLSHSDLSKVLRLDFYKARRIRNALSEMNDVEAQIDPDDAQEDHLYKIKNFDESAISILNESGHQRAQRRKKVLLELIKSRKTTFAHRLKMDLWKLEHEAGISTAVDRKTVVNLLQQLADDGHVRMVRANTDDQETTLMVVSSDQSIVPAERDNTISVRDADMIGGTFKVLRQRNSTLITNIEHHREEQSTVAAERCASGLYGYVAKFQRCSVFHKFLFYILYINHDKQQSDASAEPSTVVKSQWYDNIPKLPMRINQPSVVALGDVLLCMPLCIYTNLVRIPVESQNLVQLLTDDTMSHMLIHSLPDHVKSQILRKRKFLFQLETTLKNLVMMGLVKFITNQSGSLEKQNTLIHVSRKVRFFQNSETTNKGNEFKSVDFELNSMEDLDSLWQFIMTTSLIDERFRPTLRRRRHRCGNCRNVRKPKSKNDSIYFDPAYLDAMVPLKDVPTVYLDIPGNKDGPLGIDRRMYSWLSTNWSIYSLTESVIKEFRKRFPGAIGPPLPYLCCQLNFDGSNKRSSISWIATRHHTRSKDKTVKFARGAIRRSTGYRKRKSFEIIESPKRQKRIKSIQLDDTEGVLIETDKELDTSESADETDISERKNLFPEDDRHLICANSSLQPDITDIEKHEEKDLEGQSSTISDLNDDNNKHSIISFSEKPKANSLPIRSRKAYPTDVQSIDEFKRMLHILRASLMFLSVRLERFLRPNKNGRMSTNHLIGWLIDELSIPNLDPRNKRPSSNIRKTLNSDSTKDAASALCLQMSLDDEMMNFMKSCKLSTTAYTSSTTSSFSRVVISNEYVEKILKEFYKKFRDKFSAYIFKGQSLIVSKIDLRTINMDDYEVCRRPPKHHSPLIGEFFKPSNNLNLQTFAVSVDKEWGSTGNCDKDQDQRRLIQRCPDRSEDRKKIRSIILCLMLSSPEERKLQTEQAYELLKKYPEWLINEILYTMHSEEHLIVKKKVLANKDLDKLSVGRIYELHSRFTRDYRPISGATIEAMEKYPESIDGSLDAPWVPAAMIADFMQNIDLYSLAANNDEPMD